MATPMFDRIFDQEGDDGPVPSDPLLVDPTPLESVEDPGPDDSAA